MSAKYNEDFKKEVVDAYIKSAKSYAEITAEFNISKTSVRDCTKKYSEECQYTTNNKNNNNNKSNIDYVNEINALIVIIITLKAIKMSIMLKEKLYLIKSNIFFITITKQ